jgi:hypothetical protein
MAQKLIDFEHYRLTFEKHELERQLNPNEHVREQREIEKHPTYFQKTVEREGRSNWSGGEWGGRSRDLR